EWRRIECLDSHFRPPRFGRNKCDPFDIRGEGHSPLLKLILEKRHNLSGGHIRNPGALHLVPDSIVQRDEATVRGPVRWECGDGNFLLRLVEWLSRTELLRRPAQQIKNSEERSTAYRNRPPQGHLPSVGRPYGSAVNFRRKREPPAFSPI